MNKSDKAIKENIKKEHTVKTFFKQVSIDEETGCHNWQGYRFKDNYGRFTVYSEGGPVVIRAHRFAYAYHYGFDSLPEGLIEGGHRLVLNHLCFNTLCVNPLHLESITQTKNLSTEKKKPKVKQNA